MQTLIFPKINNKIRRYDGVLQIYDYIRKKYVALLPEEWVRQHLISYLINELEYPKSLIHVERGINYNYLKKRSDIMVMSPYGKCLVLIECKSYKVPINQKAFDQIMVYNKNFLANYIVLCNGMEMYCCELSEDNKYKFHDQLPNYRDLS